jgi:VWFA-related protein
MAFSRHARGAPLRTPFLAGAAAFLSGLFVASLTALNSQQTAPSGSVRQGTTNPPDSYSIKADVRRVVVDVVVTDSQGNPKRGLTEKDFFVKEDGRPQRILSFDPHADDAWTGLLPANVPPNTFINLPRRAEQGPLYLLFYDMVNTGDGRVMGSDYSANIFARQQLIKFVNGKPPGTRFALIVLSDGLHLVQGFTNDKQLLLTALDPQGYTPHMPKVFLYSANYGIGDPNYYLAIMKDIAHYLDGYSGRKNIIWVSGSFPFAVFAVQESPDTTVEARDVRQELAEMAAHQIAIYPVGAGGIHDMNEQNLVLDEVADETGGHAFYGSNDLAGDITKATDDGEVYYTLSYSSTNKNYDGKLRHIEIKLAKQGYHLAYRREYYADVEASADPVDVAAAKLQKQAGPTPPPDTLFAYIRHGAPMSHDLLFSAHAQAIGAPKLATPEQMADLADEPAFFRKRHKNKQLKPLPPVPLQSYQIEFDIPSKQFRAQAATRDSEQDSVELAVAAYNSDGVLLNGEIGNATSTTREQQKYYRAIKQFDVPTTATWISLAVRDVVTGRIGNVEFSLPLAPETAKSTGTD